MKKVGFLYLLIATFTYGVLQVVDKIVLNSGVEAASYTISRVFISMVFVFVLISLQGKYSLYSFLRRENLKDLVIIGVLASGIGLLFQIIGLSFTTATNVSILLALVAPLTSLFAFLILKESLSKMFLFASLLMLAGVLLIYLENSVASFGFGDFLVVLAVVGFAYSNVYARKTIKNIPTAVVTFGRLMFGSISLALLTPFLKFSFSSLFNAPLWVILCGSIFGIRMIAYYKGIEIEGASVAATFLLFSPAVTVILAVMLLGEPLTVSIVTGLVSVVLGGLLLVRVKLA